MNRIALRLIFAVIFDVPTWPIVVFSHFRFIF